MLKGDSPLHQLCQRGRSEFVRACARNACIRLSVRFGPRGHAMEVENISTSTACPRAPQRTENLMLLQVRSARSGETRVMENHLKARFPLGDFVRATRSENKNPAP